jgi:hypothetical protein
MNTPAIVLLALAPLVLWRIYARVRRMVGRQRLSRMRPWTPLCLFPILVALLALASLQHPLERTAQGLFYTPNAYLGSALSLVLAGRILYRLAELYAGGLPAAGVPADFARSPLTLAIFGTLAGYYVAYAIGLLRWRRRAPIT